MKNVVILGAGYGSLSCIKGLNNDFFTHSKVTLISENSYHYLSILLHEVVSGVRYKSAQFALKDILPREINFVQQQVKEIKADGVVCEDGVFPYDTLIVGLGFQSDTFGIEGIKEYAMPVVNFKGALLLRDKIQMQIQKYKNTRDPKDLKIVVCGGGFSGIELIASLAQSLQALCLKEGIDSSLLSLTCIEAMPNILPMFSPSLVDVGVNYLKGLKITLAVGCKILKCLENGVLVQKNEQEELIEAAIIIWTAGVKGNEVIEKSPFFISQRSKVEVDAYLHPINQQNEYAELMKNIFVIGDCAALKDPTSGRFYPPTAQIANKQGDYVAKVLQSQDSHHEPFTYQAEGTICSLGEKYAIGLMGTKEVKGLMAILLKRVIEMKWRYKIYGISGIFKSDQ